MLTWMRQISDDDAAVSRDSEEDKIFTMVRLLQDEMNKLEKFNLRDLTGR